MATDIRIALDAMGGDYGPAVVMPAASIALERRPDVRFLLFGDRKAIDPYLASDPRLATRSQVFHTDVAVKMTDKPSQALRTGRRVSSMWQAIEAVKTGKADCVDLGRQHRRADGDVEVLPAHHGPDRPSGDRGAVADDARRIDRARRRGDDRRRRARISSISR